MEVTRIGVAGLAASCADRPDAPIVTKQPLRTINASRREKADIKSVINVSSIGMTLFGHELVSAIVGHEPDRQLAKSPAKCPVSYAVDRQFYSVIKARVQNDPAGFIIPQAYS